MVRTLVSWVAKSAAVLGVLLAFPISGYASATGGSIVQSNNEQFDEEQGGRAAPGSGNRPQSAGHGKIGQTLAELFASGGQAPAGGGKARGHFASNEGGKARVAGGRVLIDAVADRDALLLLIELQELGLTRGAVAGNIVSGWLPISALDQVNSASSLRFARPSVPITLGGSVTSQGDEAMLADLARASFAVDGSGVTIGVLSDTFNCLGGAPSDVASGDLPSGILVLDPGLCTASSVDEGRAMMQLIFDVAPGANFIFHSGFGGQADFALGIDELAAAGADVIVDDVLYFSEPMFQDGAIAQAVDRVVEAGVPYFAAAGNFGDRGYESQFLSGMSGSVFGHNYDFHNFDTGAAVDVLQRVTIPVGTGVRFVLQWDEPFFSVSGAPGSSNVVDLFISSDDGSTLLARTPLSGVLGGDPVDEVTFFNPGPATEFSVLIGHDLDEGGPPPGRVKYVMFGTGSIAEYETGGGTIYGHANAAGAQTVGAAYYQNTPAFGTSPAVLQDYSSVGTTRVLFDAAGARLGSPEIRQKPNIVGPDGGDTTFLGTDTDGNGFPNFFGTSAAAPHVSGVAALMLTLYPSLTPAQLYATLESTALDMGEPGVDVYTGHGLVQAEAALASLQVTDLTLDNIVSNTTPLVGDDVTFALTLTNEGGTAEATGVAVLDLLPTGLTYVSHTASVGSYEPVTGLWGVAALAQNGVATLNISANVTSTGAIMSTAEIVAADQADPDSTPNNGLATEDDQASVTLTASPATADLRLTNIVSNTSPVVGDDVTFTLSLSNEGGTAEATGVAVRDLLPIGLTYLTHSGDAGSYDDLTGAWVVGTLAQGGVATLQVSATVTSTGGIINTAEIVAADQADPDSTPNNGLATEDDQASVTLTASPATADLRLTNIVSNTTLLVGDDVTFALTLTNEGGTAEATGVAVLDLLPTGLTYVSHTASVGSYEPVTGLWGVAALAQNGVATLNISANVTSTGAIMSTAEIVAADQADPDSTPNNGLASEDDQASVTLTASPMAVHLITNVTAASGNAYERHKIAEGDAVYTDSTKVFTNVPLTLDGHEYVRTANSDKDAIDAAFVSFSLTSEADVYVLYDDRATRLPAWLDDGTWTSSGMRVDIKGGRLLAYLKHFPAGPVQLGGNAMAPMQRARVNYSIVAIPYVAGDVSPSVGITSPEHGSSTGSGLAILFVGTSEDAEDGDLTESIVWKSDIDGLLGIGGTFARSLADGTHTITAEVADSAGQIATSSVVVIVGPPPSGGRLSVASMDYFTVGGKFSDKHLQVTISIADDSGGPAAGASVSLHILLNDGVVGSFMGTTTVEGTAEFGIKNASPGCYSIEVVDISTGAASWDGVTPDNVFCKP